MTVDLDFSQDRRRRCNTHESGGKGVNSILHEGMERFLLEVEISKVGNIMKIARVVVILDIPMRCQKLRYILGLEVDGGILSGEEDRDLRTLGWRGGLGDFLNRSKEFFLCCFSS